ncbi:hypothetical protein ACLFMI_07155 [Pseudonocardia nantongensis]|uniref:hypothetical protein n=1 Tax=Pseudonocardia nantongensis TaxID=1181885 RepID=UPI00397D46B7
MRRITRTGMRGIGLLVATGALCAATVVPAGAAEPGTTWQPDLGGGNGTGVVVTDGTARFDAATAHGAPVDDGSGTEASADPTGVVPTGLLTLPPRSLDTATTEVDATLEADTPAGSTASIDIRGRRTDGAWTEWIPAGDITPGRPSTVDLPAASREVQGRVVLTSTGSPAPSVRGVTLSAAPAGATEALPEVESAPRSYSVFATREGLVGGTTANGHKIVERDRFVALPSRRALSPDGKSDYSVKVCAPNGRCAFAPVWDIGPWNTKDDYWNPSPERQMWKDLPQGRPQAAAAFEDGHNGGNDQFGRRPANPAGIDLGDGIFWDVLGLKDNSQVQVDYLWTGSQRLSAISAEGAPDVEILAEPRAGAEVVGTAADTADVPVECVHGTGDDAFVKLGERQFLPLSSFAEAPAGLPGCDAGSPPAGGEPPAEPAPAAPSSTEPSPTQSSPTQSSPTQPSPTQPSTGAPAAAGPDSGGPGSDGRDAAGPGDPTGGPEAATGEPEAPAASGAAPADTGAPATTGAPEAGAPGSTGTPGSGSAPATPGTPTGDSQAAVIPGSAQRAPSGHR